ncbi:MAG: hypothetical protein IKO78_02560 [Bacilli bacterium]|nr:hypothetical protein [Bacilli bacterium]
MNNLIEVSKDYILSLKTGTKYYVYNPLTDRLKEEYASPIDIVHNKHCYDKLKFYVENL